MISPFKSNRYIIFLTGTSYFFKTHYDAPVVDPFQVAHRDNGIFRSIHSWSLNCTSAEFLVKWIDFPALIDT